MGGGKEGGGGGHAPIRTPTTSPQSAKRPAMSSSVADQGRLPTKIVVLPPEALAAPPLTSTRCFFWGAGYGMQVRRDVCDAQVRRRACV